MLSWKSHLNTHSNTIIRCPVCGEKFGKEKQLEKHKREKHSGKPDGGDRKEELAKTILYCEQCDYYTARKGNLVKHTKTKHTSGSANVGETVKDDGKKKRDEENSCLKVTNNIIQILSDDWDF